MSYDDFSLLQCIMAVILCQEEERKRLKEVQKKTELGYVDMLSMHEFEK